MKEKYLTVTALTKYLKYKFESDENLRTVYIKGEISNFKAHSTGHFYFSIKDETSRINAIMFSSSAKKLNFMPKEGMKILCTGSIRIYEATGNYQIYVEDLLEDGVGNLYIAFEQLKEKLAKEGLFDPKYKKKIPKYPEKIGIVTAPTGAAIRDILSTIKRRYPMVQTYLFPALVQGEMSAIDIIKKIKQAENFDLDVLIVGRGGGSFEDLNSFNDEALARTIFDCPIPIISAVGHEIDFTIADFVADLRAPTPTAAAELAVPNIIDLKNTMQQYKIRFNEAITKSINLKKLYLDSVKNSFVIKNPMIMYENPKQKLDYILEKLNTIIEKQISQKKEYLNHLKQNYILTNPETIYQNQKIALKTIIEKLDLVNPLNILKRGYSLTTMNDKIIKSINDIKIKDHLTIKLTDGTLEAVVEKIGGSNGKEKI